MGRTERMESIDPIWEPIPWDTADETAETMYSGFIERAATPIHWREVPFADFPEEGLLGHGRQWFVDHDVGFFGASEEEDLLLMDKVWFGWPDPPRWGLASRPRGRPDCAWQMWGNFPDPPATWTFPEGRSPNA